MPAPDSRAIQGGVVLAVDTSTRRACCAIASDGKTVDSIQSVTGNSHVEDCQGLARELLDRNSMTVSDLSRVVLGNGPGSFTGLRIGAGFVGGLTAALRLPSMYCSSFWGYVPTRRRTGSVVFACCADAGRGELYAAIFVGEDGKLSLRSPVGIVSAQHLSERIEETRTPSGEGVSERFWVCDSERTAEICEGVVPEGVELLHTPEPAKGLLYLLNGESFSVDGEVFCTGPVKLAYHRGVAARTIEERGADFKKLI